MMDSKSIQRLKQWAPFAIKLLQRYLVGSLAHERPIFPIIKKPVSLFVLQINWLFSIWWGTLVVNGLMNLWRGNLLCWEAFINFSFFLSVFYIYMNYFIVKQKNLFCRTYLLYILYIYIYIYKQLESDASPQSCLYFQVFQGSKLLSGCLVVWSNKQILNVFQ